MRLLFIMVFLSTYILGMQITKRDDFVGKINTLKVKNNILYIGGEGGIIAFDENMQKVFVSTEVGTVENISLVNIDSDDKDEVLVSGWLSFSLIDDDGTRIAKNDIFASMVSSAMPITHYMDGDTLKVIYSEPGDSSINDSIKEYSYTKGDEWFNPVWNLYLDEYASVPTGGLKYTNGYLYSMQIGYQHNMISKHDVTNGDVIDELNSSLALSTFEIDTQNDRLLVGADNSLKIYKLSDFSLLHTYNTTEYIKTIKYFDNKIAIVANDKGWISDATSNEVFILELTTEGLEQKFYLQTNEKETNALDFASDGSVYFNVGTKLFKVDGTTYEKTVEKDLDNGIYDPIYNNIQAISAIAFGDFNITVGSLDIYGLNSQGQFQTAYTNGFLAQNLSFVNIDSDQAQEKWASDGWYRTYLFDDNGSILWSLPFGTSIAKEYDINNDGTNELVMLGNDYNVTAFNKNGELVFSHGDNVLNFDIKDIDNDGLAEIAYIKYSDYNSNDGDILKVVDTDGKVEFEKDIYTYVTNINLFSYVKNPNGGYSIVFNDNTTYRVDLNESLPMQYIEGDGFVDDFFISAEIKNIDSDTEMELVRATKDGVYAYDIFPEPTYDEAGYLEHPMPLSQFDFNTPLTELRGMALFDKERDGTYEILLTYDEKLALYSLDGTKIWEYTDTVDTGLYEDNHFTHIKPLYADDGNHKIYVSGYSLYEFDKNGNFLSKAKATSSYMVNSSGNYANPFDINNEGEIFLGQLGYYDINTNVSTVLSNPVVSLKKGWNLISFPVVLTLSHDELLQKFPNAEHFWGYNNSSSSTWSYASNKSANESLFDTHIVSLSQENGFWVYNTKDEDISFDGTKYDISTNTNFSLLTDKWKLWGNPTITDASEICLLNENLKVIWAYNGAWSAHGCTSEYSGYIDDIDSLPALETLKDAQGFWSYIQ